jgi:hypothetical protein
MQLLAKSSSRAAVFGAGKAAAAPRLPARAVVARAAKEEVDAKASEASGLKLYSVAPSRC